LQVFFCGSGFEIFSLVLLHYHVITSKMMQ
jgi:hypothetical protein